MIGNFAGSAQEERGRRSDRSAVPRSRRGLGAEVRLGALKVVEVGGEVSWGGGASGKAGVYVGFVGGGG
jgi:hypothetical protein